MSDTPPGGSWLTAVWRGTLVLVLAALGARLVWELLEPLLPLALGVLVLIGVISLLRRPRSL